MTGTPPDLNLKDVTEAPAAPGLLLSERLARWWQAGIDLVFPPRCAGCGRVDMYWCDRCDAEVAGLPFAQDVKALPPLHALAATGEHSGKLQQAVHALKYENAPAVAVPLARRMTRLYRLKGWRVDTVLPVPLHTSRQRKRGYNQAQQLAEQIAVILSLPCTPNALVRERETRSQVGLSAAERRKNVTDAFRGDPRLLAAKAILLIDDVYTTGATMSACAQAALDAGAVRVFGLTATAARLA